MSATEQQPALDALIFLPADRQNNPAFHPHKLKIYGLTLLERTCRALEKFGARNIYLVAGTEMAAAENFIRKTAPWQANLVAVQAENWEREVPAGYDCIEVKEPVVVSQQALHELINYGNQNPQAVVETDWLSFSKGSGTAKKEKIFWALSVTEMVQPVQHALDLKKAKTALRRSLVKPTDGWVSKNLNRPISISISRVLARTSLTPNQFTVFTGLLGVLTGWLLAQGGYWGFLTGSFLFHLTSVLDGVDGELARLKFKSSPFGQWLDTMVDNSSYVFALAGFLVGLYGDGVSAYEKIAGLTALGLLTLALTSLFLYLKLWNKGGSLLNVEWTFKDGKTRFDRFLLGLGALGKRDLFALIFFGLGIIGQLQLALIYVCVMTGMMVGFSIPAHLAAARKSK